MNTRILAAAIGAASSLVACGDNVTPSEPIQPVGVSARVSGLTGGGLALRLNGGKAVPVAADGTIRFERELEPGSMYDISVAKQPSEPTQTCTVQNGSGIVGESPIEISVACVVNTYNVGGMVHGLMGEGLSIDINGIETAEIGADGAFRFEEPLASGTEFTVGIKSQPTKPSQTCKLHGASGVIGDGPISSILVNCSTDEFAIGGTVSGLEGVAVIRNKQEMLMLTGNGEFAFPTTIASGDTYDVAVITQPGTPSQTCTVSHGEGSVDAADISNIAIECVTNTFSVGGGVDGLAGSGLVLRNNQGDDLAVSADGTFTFGTNVKSGADYDVTVATQPTNPSQTCTVAGAHGTIGGGAVTSVAVNCTTDRHTVGGAVTGLDGTLNIGMGDQLLYITGNGEFAFPATIASGDDYNVTVLAQPGAPAQTCTVLRGNGTIESDDISDVSIACTTNRYTVGGNVSGLAKDSSLLLINNNEIIEIGNGSFTFPTSIESGGAYNIQIVTQPMTPSQTCHITSGSGLVGSEAINNIGVTCHINRYAIGVTVSGLAYNTELVLVNNATDELSVPLNGLFYFSNSVDSGQAYNVSVQAQPEGQECTVIHGQGFVDADNVMDVAVTCVAVQPQQPTCQPGWFYIDPIGCVQEPNCGDGMVFNEVMGVCEYPQAETCPSGTYMTTVGTCEPIDQICPSGMYLTSWGTCEMGGAIPGGGGIPGSCDDVFCFEP